MRVWWGKDDGGPFPLTLNVDGNTLGEFVPASIWGGGGGGDRDPSQAGGNSGHGRNSRKEIGKTCLMRHISDLRPPLMPKIPYKSSWLCPEVEDDRARVTMPTIIKSSMRVSNCAGFTVIAIVIFLMLPPFPAISPCPPICSVGLGQIKRYKCLHGN